MKSAHIFGIACAIAAIGSATFAQGQSSTAPGTTSSATTPAPATAPEAPAVKTMKFQFNEAPVASVLREISTHFGFILVLSQPVPGRITVNVPEPVTAEEALRLTNSLIIPMGFAVVETELPVGDQTIIRVMTFKEAKQYAPVVVIRP